MRGGYPWGLWCAAWCLAASGAWAGDTPDAADVPTVEQIPCPFEDGTTHRWTQRTTQQGMQAVSSEAELEVRTVRAGDEALWLTAQRRAVTVQSDDTTAKAMTQARLDPRLVYKIRYAPDTGAASVVNQDELAPVASELAAALEGALAEAGVGEAVIALSKQAVLQPALLSRVALGAIRPLLRYSCGPLALGKTSFEATLDSPVGGSPLPSSGTLEVARDGDALRVVTEETLSKEGLRALISAVQQQVAPDAPPAVRKTLAALPLRVAIETTTTVSLQTGLATRVHTVRTVSVAGMQEREETEVRLAR